MTGWHALRAARTHDEASRVPFEVMRPGHGAVAAGSVALAHVKALTRWPRWLRASDDHVALIAPAEAWTDALATMNDALRADGLIRAWRDEPFTLFSTAGEPLGVAMERAATRFWGTLTLGAHCNGYVADASGAPQSMWIARRSASKPTDPGKLDNLIGGGVPHGQSPHDTVVREGWEEAGLAPEQMGALQRGGIVRLLRDIPEGLQREWIHVFDLALPPQLTPSNQDGEVAEVKPHACADALTLAAGDAMTVDAALVTLEFALRRRLLPPPLHATLAADWARWQQAAA